MVNDLVASQPLHLSCQLHVLQRQSLGLARVQWLHVFRDLGKNVCSLLRWRLLWCLVTNLYRCLDLIVSQTKKFWQPHLQSNAKGTNGNKMAGLKMWRAQNAIKEANINIAETGKKQTFSLQAVS